MILVSDYDAHGAPYNQIKTHHHSYERKKIPLTKDNCI